jgi:hypothetical protein
MRLCLCLLAAPVLFAQTGVPTPDVNEIMRRVAANQDRADQARNSIVYTQDIFARLLRDKSKVARQEKRVYTVAPKPDGQSRELVKFEGWYEKRGGLHPYDHPDFRHQGLDLDGELIDSFIGDLTQKDEKDGIEDDYFPLSASKQRGYVFKLLGTKMVQGVEAWRIRFEPEEKGWDEDEGRRMWAGEALIHPGEYQPLTVSTNMAVGLPAWVKVTLGTNIKQLGFNVTYRKVADGLWFPETYGTEFHLRVLFGFARTITLSLKNSDFRKAAADSVITYDPIPVPETTKAP